jgi:hypothetical protein
VRFKEQAAGGCSHQGERSRSINCFARSRVERSTSP